MGRSKRVFFLNIHFLFGQSFGQTNLPLTMEEIKKTGDLLVSAVPLSLLSS